MQKELLSLTIKEWIQVICAIPIIWLAFVTLLSI